MDPNSTVEQPFIQNPIWVAGHLFMRDPKPVVTPLRFEKQTRGSGLGLRVSRPLRPPGWPNLPEVKEISMPWPNATEAALLQHVDILAKVGRPFGVIIWKNDFETFDCDGEIDTFYIPRIQAPPTVTPPRINLASYEFRVLIYDGSYLDGGDPVASTDAAPGGLTLVHKTNATIYADGTPAPGEVWVEDDGHLVGNKRVTTVRFGTAPPVGTDNLAIQYLPLYRCVVKSDAPRSYATQLMESRTLVFAEI